MGSTVTAYEQYILHKKKLLLQFEVLMLIFHTCLDHHLTGLTLIMQDYLNNWRETALILTAILFPAAGIWFIGKFLLVISSLFSQQRYIQVNN